MYEIINNLFLSAYHTIDCDFDSTTISSAFIVNCTKDLEMLNGNNIRIAVDDDMSDEAINGMLEALPNVIQLIDDNLKNNKKVIVHCLAGRQRSATVIAAYLMSKHGYSLQDAIEYIRTKKRDAFFPSVNFMNTLKKYDGEHL